MNKAEEIVTNYIKEFINSNVKQEDLFIVWSCYILGNRKYLIGCKNIPHYFEVTYNNNKKEWYLDVYIKNVNRVIRCT